MSNKDQRIDGLIKGDRRAFQEIYHQFGQQVYNTAISYIQNEADAEEITQDVFVSIFKNAKKFKGNSTLSTWIYRITINTSLNYLKKKKRISLLPLNKPEEGRPDFEHPGVLLEKKEEAKTLFKLIDTLPDGQKTAFILSFVEELPRKEVADIMEISLKAVESLLQRAKQNLRTQLKSMYPSRRKSNK